MSQAGEDEPFLARLAARLAGPLPGREAQERFSPTLAYGRHFDRAPADARQAAVAILLYPQAGEWWLPLVLRTASMSSHASQIALPGGMIEPGELPEQAALRELEEELGVDRSTVRLLGPLSPIWVFVTNFQVSPWICTVGQRPDLRPCEHEVAEVIEMPARWLLDPANIAEGQRTERGVTFTAPYWRWQERQIWGATAIILGELEGVLRDHGSP